MSPHRSLFWKVKSLSELTRREWESLCDGCGRCCLQKLEDKQTGRIDYTGVSCYLLDIDHCRCKAYKQRARLVKTCLPLTPARVMALRWLPKTCAYRLVAHGQDLEWWHPLITGDSETVHQAGISVRGQAISEEFIHPDDLADFIIRTEQ